VGIKPQPEIRFFGALRHPLLAMVWRARAFLASRRAAAALMIALSAPMLIAATGLSVDIGYWFEQQEALQSATDAAAVASAIADAKYGDTTAASILPFALAAANKATNNQFGITSSALTVTPLTATSGSNGSTVSGFKVTAQIPRGSFFSSTHGLGLFGLPAGTQSTSSTADVVTQAEPACLITTNTSAVSSIYANGSSQISGSNCAFYADSTACGGADEDAIDADPSGQIVAPSIATSGCTYANTVGGAYVGVTSGSASDQATGGYQVTNHGSAPADPLAGMGTPPAWPAMPTPATSGYTSLSGMVGYSPESSNGVSCGGYSADCTIASGNYSGLGNINAAEVQFNDPSTGKTNIIGGLAGSENVELVLNAPSYFIAGAANASNVVDGYAVTINTPSFTVAGGSDDFDGGMYLNGSNAVTSFGTGTYMFSAYTVASGTAPAALDDSNSNITFAGGTYYFNGGLTVEGNGTITFGPGIYYIENGNLSFEAGSHIIVNGATFVLENGAGYELNGGSVALNMTAPSTPDCVPPASYPESAYTDGTDGQGICGVLIYQARTDTTADAVNEGANTTMTGIIYAAGGALTVSGGATITSSNTSDTFTLIVNTISATGGTKVEPSLGTGSSGANISQTATLLVN
jgi:Flp pilus assembly protein TadG